MDLDGSTRNWLALLQTIENFEAMPNVKFRQVPQGLFRHQAITKKTFPG
jgi:hypothetical protein